MRTPDSTLRTIAAQRCGICVVAGYLERNFGLLSRQRNGLSRENAVTAALNEKMSADTLDTPRRRRREAQRRFVR